MPMIRVTSVLQLEEAQKLRLFTLLTDFFVEQGVPAEAVNVIVERVDLNAWSVAGEPLSLRLASASKA